jgi:Zn-dependent M28 family amino/carboxypeptidase
MKPANRSVRASLLAFVVVAAALTQPRMLLAQAPEPAKGVKFAAINEADLKQWLTYLSSDELQGRQVFTEGYGVAAEYVADHLRQWGVKPLGDDGTYFQIVKLRSYRVIRNSTVTVAVNGQVKTFRDGDHVTFAASAGGKQTLVLDGAEFVGAGQAADFAGRDVRGKLVLEVSQTGGRRGRAGGRGGIAIQTAGAAAVIVYSPPPPAPTAADEALARAQQAFSQASAALAAAEQQVQAQRGGRAFGDGPGVGRDASSAAPFDIAPTTQRVDGIVPPQVMADDAVFDFLLSGSATKFADLESKLASGDPMPPFAVSGAKVTIAVDNTYEPVTTQLSRNVAGMVEGSDPRLKDTYVLFGAHLDHVGYATSNQDARGRVNNPIEQDKIWNGADDDGTGTTAEMAIAKAFAGGPKPKRSVVFLWHTGEEANLYGSKYNADFPVVPIDKIQCQLNIDMIGRNRDNDPKQANTLFVIGADRISTDLHNLVVDTNATLAVPLTLDYEYNDLNDPNSFYTRSDHYSYASKGIPIAFFFTGTHPDYHANSDSVEKILFDKQAHVAQLVYQTGFAVANSDRVLVRDNQGSRSGKGFQGRIK